MRDTPRRPNPGDETEASGLPKASQDKTGKPGEAQSENKRQVNEPLRRPGRPPAVDPKDLQALLEYRDERARAEARLVRAKRLEQTDRRRASVPEPDDPTPTPPGRSTADGKPRQASQDQGGQQPGEARSENTRRTHEPPRRPDSTQEVDPKDLQSLLDYRDERARAEARLLRVKNVGRDDRRRANPPEHDEPLPASPTPPARPNARTGTTVDRASPPADGSADRADLANEPPRRPGAPRQVDPEDLQSLLDYRDERARLERAGRLQPRTDSTASPGQLDSDSTTRGPKPTDSSVGRADPSAAQKQPSIAEQTSAAPNVLEMTRAAADPLADSVDDGGDAAPTAGRTATDRARDLHLDLSPELVADLGFDPSLERGALGDQFRPGLLDPHGEIARKEDVQPKVAEKELKVIKYLVEERGALVTLLPESEGVKNPDSIVRWGPTDKGGTVEFKTLASPNPNAIDHNLRRGSNQLVGQPDPQLLIDGRDVHTHETTARRVWAKRVRTSPSTAPTVHFILDRGRWLTLPDDRRRGS